jgi:hypothetical protein
MARILAKTKAGVVTDLEERLDALPIDQRAEVIVSIHAIITRAWARMVLANVKVEKPKRPAAKRRPRRLH